MSQRFRAQSGVLAVWLVCLAPGDLVLDAAPTLVTGQALVAGQVPARGEATRDAWQRVPDIFAAMGVREGAVVADIGAGSGYFTTRLAKAVGPTGRVYAVDVSANAVNSLRQRIEREGLTNVEVLLGVPADPKLPAEQLDAALIVNAYHEMTEHQAMLAAIKRALKPSGRLVIVEPIVDPGRGAPRQRQAQQHQIAPQYVQEDALAAGFVITRLEDPFTRRSGSTPEYLLALSVAPPAVADMPEHVHTGAGAGVMDDVSRQPDAVVAALGLKPGQVVVDIGAGSGVFTRRFAHSVGPSGRAIGVDIEPDRVEALKADAVALNLPNYEARLVSPDNPAIPPASADLIFLSNTYHHIENRIPYFTRIRESLKPGGRLVIIDFVPAAVAGTVMENNPDHKQVESELGAAGFRLVKTHSFLERQFFLEFVKR